MATSSSTFAFPQQQFPATSSTPTTTTPEAISSSPTGWHSSGSIGPFFAVISVISVLAFISCAIGRAYSRQVADPATAQLSSIERNGSFKWLKERSREVVHGGAELGSRLKWPRFWRKGGSQDPPQA